MDKKIKVLAICGSPHKGNTFEILDKLRFSKPEVDFKIIKLAEQNLLDCVGCYSCVKNGEESCPLKDDRDKILEEMMAADATIFASPTYARTISALMKKFVERTSYIAHRPVFFGKYAMALATCAGFGADLTCKYLSENFTQCGFSFVNSVQLKTATKSEAEMTRNLELASAGFKKLLHAVQSHRDFKPSLGQLVYFNIFKSISELNKTNGWADYNYYRDKGDYYYDVPIPFVKNKLAKWIAGREVKKMIGPKA